MSWRRAKWLRNAEIDTIDRILSWEIEWPMRLDDLELLAVRVEDVAYERPPVGYRLALDCLVLVAQRAASPDHIGRGLTAAGVAARHLGRFGEAAELYRRAERLVTEHRSRGRLLLSRAVLATYEGHFEQAEHLATDIEHLLLDADHRAMALIVRGNLWARKYYSCGAGKEMRQALDWILQGTSLADTGGRTQLSGLMSTAAVLDRMGAPYFPLVASTLSELEADFQGRSSRGSKQIWAHVDWIHAKMAYRAGSPRAGRRKLRRAARRFEVLGRVFDTLRVAVDLVELEADWGDRDEGVRTGLEIVEALESNGIDSIRRSFDKLAQSDPETHLKAIGSLRAMIEGACVNAA